MRKNQGTRLQPPPPTHTGVVLDESDLEDIRGLASGRPVAYVDRIRRRFRAGKVPPSAGQHGPLPMSEAFRRMLDDGGWRNLFSGAAWSRHLPSSLAVFVNATWGFSADLAKEAALWLRQKTGIARPPSKIGVLESIFASKNARPCATVRVPKSGGGWERHEFELVSDPEILMCLGQGVEFVPAHRGIRARIRPISPPSAIGEDGLLKHLNVFELAGIVEAHNDKMSFCGLWRRTELPSLHRGESCLSGRLAGLYVHEATGEGVLVFRGTQPLSLADWVVNVKATHGVGTYQYERCIPTVEAAREMCPKLMLTGHSKGGGMAQYAAVETGLPVVTFNTVGLPPFASVPDPPPPSDHFMTKFDAVSNVSGKFDPESMGIMGPLAASRGHLQPVIGGRRSVHILPPCSPRNRVWTLHSVASLRSVLRENPHVIPDPTSPTRNPAYPVKGVVVDVKKNSLLYEVAAAPVRRRPAYGREMS